MSVSDDRDANVDAAIRKIRAAVLKYPTARLFVLPECFNSPYGPRHFARYAELIPSGNTSQRLAAIARELRVYVLGGSIPERDADRPEVLYNTAPVFGPDGRLVARHRKAHLYDVDLGYPLVGEAHRFAESSVLTPGNELTSFCIDRGVRIGVGICFDIYSDEYARALRRIGCDVLIYPAAFNPHIGPMHWDLLNRARAADNQVYTMAVSPARGSESAEYVAWAYSMVSDPWGRVLMQAGVGEETLFAELGECGGRCVVALSLIACVMCGMVLQICEHLLNTADRFRCRTNVVRIFTHKKQTIS